MMSGASGSRPASGVPFVDPDADPTQRYNVVTGNYRGAEGLPASSSNQISAAVRLEAPDLVYAEEPFDLTAHGSYNLSPELRRLVASGQAQVKEVYAWELNPAGYQGEPGPTTHRVTCFLMADAPSEEETNKDMIPGLWVAYVVAVLKPDGTYEWARAEDHRLPRVWRFGILPVSPALMKRGETEESMPGQGNVGQPLRFEAQAFREPGDAIKSGVDWQWNFDDGTTATGNPVTHVFKQIGVYLVYVRGSYQGRAAEYLMDIFVQGSTGSEHNSTFPLDRAKAIGLTNGYAPPHK